MHQGASTSLLKVSLFLNFLTDYGLQMYARGINFFSLLKGHYFASNYCHTPNLALPLSPLTHVCFHYRLPYSSKIVHSPSHLPWTIPKFEDIFERKYGLKPLLGIPSPIVLIFYHGIHNQTPKKNMMMKEVWIFKLKNL